MVSRVRENLTIDKLLNEQRNLLEQENFKFILKQASKSKINCNQLSKILKKIHEEFIFHINNLQSNINLSSLNLNSNQSSTTKHQQQEMIKVV